MAKLSFEVRRRFVLALAALPFSGATAARVPAAAAAPFSRATELQAEPVAAGVSTASRPGASALAPQLATVYAGQVDPAHVDPGDERLRRRVHERAPSRLHPPEAGERHRRVRDQRGNEDGEEDQRRQADETQTSARKPHPRRPHAREPRPRKPRRRKPLHGLIMPAASA